MWLWRITILSFRPDSVSRSILDFVLISWEGSVSHSEPPQDQGPYSEGWWVEEGPKLCFEGGGQLLAPSLHPPNLLTCELRLRVERITQLFLVDYFIAGLQSLHFVNDLFTGNSFGAIRLRSNIL